MLEGKCACGVSYAVKRGGNAVAYCALSIRCGTRDEMESGDEALHGGDGLHGGERQARHAMGFHSGTAHFVEHTIFKGTTHRNAANINSCLDKLGGELNAYTTKEEIVLHATVLKEDLNKAGSLLFEIVTCPTFPEDEVETERGVIIDEINSYKDAPAEEIYDVFEEFLFKGHPLSGPILGTVKSVRKITSEELARFVREKFVPENMAFTVVADIDENVLVRKIEKIVSKFFSDSQIFGKNVRSFFPKFPLEATERTDGSALADGVAGGLAGGSGAGACPLQAGRGFAVPKAELNPPQFNLTLSRKNHQVNCVIGCLAPTLYDHSERIAMVLLTNVLGGPASNSILNAILREKRGWVYAVECSYTQYADSGIVAVSLGCEKENLEKCLKVIDRELGKLRTCPLSATRLAAAKKQLLGQVAIGGDNGENQCLSMGKSLMAYGHVFTDEEGRRQIEAVTADDLQALAVKYLSPAKISTLVFV